MEDGNRPGDKGGKGAPTKVAAALSFDAGKDDVPRVVAAGKGLLAARIEEVARRSGVPVYQDSQLAWTLVGLGLDREISPELYQVVAQVIAWVYYLENSGSGPDAGSDDTGSGGIT